MGSFLGTQLSGLSEREMNNPLTLCELTARAPNWLKQRKSPLDHPFRSICGENRKLSS